MKIMVTKKMKKLSINELVNISGGCSCRVIIRPDGCGCTDIVQPGWPGREPVIIDKTVKATL